MTKFWAMLKDSFREAVDGWIFLVMLIISGVVTLLVLSLSFTPTPTDQAIPKLIPSGRGPGNGGPMQVVSPDRGAGTKLVIYQYATTITNVRSTPSGGNPWDDKVTFDLEFSQAGFGGGVEVDDPKNPTKTKMDLKDLFADPFKEAVRTWASTTGGEKPKYTDALAKEFVAAQLKSVTRLNVTDVQKGEGAKFTVTADGSSTRLAWPHKPALFFGLAPLSFMESPLGQLIHIVENGLVNGLGAWVMLMAGVIVTAGFIPNMLRKGALDLVLVKPISRPALLVYKYLGGLLFVLLLATAAFGGVWLAIGLRTGVWAPGLLYCILGVTFYFAILYACSTLFGVLTRNAIVSIVVTIVFWFVIWLLGFVHNLLTVLDNMEVQGRPAMKRKADEKKDAKKADADDDEQSPDDTPKPPRALVRAFDIINTVTPRTKDLDTLTSSLISRDLLSEGEQRQAGLKLKQMDWGEVLGVAGAYIALFLGLAILRFVTRSN
jgi:ABC-type transport system involved in multi-copper enzyme maturation permease subunit